MESIGGLLVRFTPYYTKAGKYEPNWIMRCSKPGCRAGCHKRRGATVKFEAHYGIIEPLAFLHCWHEVEWPTKPTITSHALENPSPAAVTAFVEAHGDELRDVCKRAGR